jgi:hypothetical protein
MLLGMEKTTDLAPSIDNTLLLNEWIDDIDECDVVAARPTVVSATDDITTGQAKNILPPVITNKSDPSILMRKTEMNHNIIANATVVNTRLGVRWLIKF